MSELSFDVTLRRPGAPMRLSGQIPLSGLTALRGPSGAGKTSLLRALAGLERADGPIRLGEVRLDGLAPHRRGIGFVFQEPRLFPHLDVAANIAYGARRRGGLASIAPIVAALDLAPLMARQVGDLSGGEARRVALARALASKPGLLLLDEPMTGLDPARKAEILPYLSYAIAEAGVPALYVSHAEDETLALADRVLSIAEGQVQGWEVAPARLRAEVETDGTGRRLFCAGLALAAPPTLPHLRHWSVAIGPTTALLSRDAPGPGSALASWLAQRCEAPDDNVVLQIAAQQIRWTPTDATTWRPEIGARCHLSLLHSVLRPERDSIRS